MNITKNTLIKKLKSIRFAILEEKDLKDIERKVVNYIDVLLTDNYIDVLLTDIEKNASGYVGCAAKEWSDLVDMEMQETFENELLSEYNEDSLQEIFSDNVYSSVQEIRNAYQDCELDSDG